jgi:hypothetical protein
MQGDDIILTASSHILMIKLARNINTVIQTLRRAEAIKLLKSEKLPDKENIGSEELKVDSTLIADI